MTHDPIARGLSLCMKRLYCRERKVVWLRYQMHMSFAEISKEIGKTTRQTEAIYERAMERLVEVLDESLAD